eukprot:TRINITY_DN3247_c0_g1_i2.p1 TRINITY_DN3247_c0_g1~~TRINITY_DN3247_c0_g1_i2.p1  ORF type:complete len:356 (-),score=83.36 TRINITY_DN3247_c0_g1_i2:348-1415(-)
MIQSFPGDVEDLAEAEKYFYAVSSVPRLEARLTAMLFKLTFVHSSNDIDARVSGVLLACQEVKTSPILKQLLESVLAIGNYLNSNVTKGFTLDSLLKLKDTKSFTDNSVTLLHYLAQAVEDSQPQLLSYAEELPHLMFATKTPLESVASDLAKLQEDHKTVEAEVMRYSASTNDGDSDSSSDEEVEVEEEVEETLEVPLEEGEGEGEEGAGGTASTQPEGAGTETPGETSAGTETVSDAQGKCESEPGQGVEEGTPLDGNTGSDAAAEEASQGAEPADTAVSTDGDGGDEGTGTAGGEQDPTPPPALRTKTVTRVVKRVVTKRVKKYRDPFKQVMFEFSVMASDRLEGLSAKVCT